MKLGPPMLDTASVGDEEAQMRVIGKVAAQISERRTLSSDDPCRRGTAAPDGCWG